MACVVLVEDDHRIRSALVRALSERGHDVVASATGIDGLNRIVERAPDLVILDLGLPDIAGTELLKMVRAVSAVPVIVATARDDDSEIVRTLDAGADDYVIKPFSADHLDARMRAILRRAQGDGDGGDGAGPIELGGLMIDERARVASLDSRPLDLTRKEFDVLVYLASRPGTVVSRRELLAEVWRQPYGGADKTVDVHLSWLRRKLGETAADPRYLHTVRGVGVKLVAPEA
jgi:DNA-binding response OmpR family regulator